MLLARGCARINTSFNLTSETKQELCFLRKKNRCPPHIMQSNMFTAEHDIEELIKLSFLNRVWDYFCPKCKFDKNPTTGSQSMAHA